MDEHGETSRDLSAYNQLFALGFKVALVLTFACLVVATGYLFLFMHKSAASIDHVLDNGGELATDVQLVALNTSIGMAKVTLLSCGVFCGMAFGFAGVALFLLGVRGSVDVSGEGPGFKITAVRVAPGLVVIICASTLIAVSVRAPISSEIEGSKPPFGGGPEPQASESGPSEADDDGGELQSHTNIGGPG